MRTVFVNPVNPRRGRKRRRSGGKRRRVASHRRRRRGFRRRRRNPFGFGRRRNPGFLGFLANMAFVTSGATGGALLNRIGLSQIDSFWWRNGARVVGASALTAIGGLPWGNTFMAAAAGATLSPMLAEIEMKVRTSGATVGTTAATGNPAQLAAELAAMLEADLDGDVDQLTDDLESELSW
jgi:hypothetical protein